MPMPYTPQQVANFFLERAEQDGRALDQLQLIKLVYIAYGWVLAITGDRLFLERIEAWQHGPVIRSLYDEFKRFRRSSITQRAADYDLDTGRQQEPVVPGDDGATRTILEKVYATYGRYSGWTLRGLTHQPDTPWTRTWSEGVQDARIPDELIAPHFRDIVSRLLAELPSVVAA